MILTVKVVISCYAIGLWDEKEGFYYDVLRVDHCNIPLRIRSMVGLVPLFASLTLEEEWIEKLPGFRKRLRWFMDHRPELSQHVRESPLC